MKVSSGYNPYAYQQQNVNIKHKGFTHMLANMLANDSGKTEAEEDSAQKTNRADIATLDLHISSFHRHHATQIFLTAEQLTPTEKNDTEEIGYLTVYETGETPELIELIPDPPTYPKSIYDMSVEELRDAIRKGARYATSGVSLGMQEGETYSREEIYGRIKSVFADYLGEDYLEPYDNSDRLDEEKRNLYNEALYAFHSELKSYGVHDLTLREIRSLPSQDFDTIDRYPTSRNPAPPLYPQSIHTTAPKDIWAALDSVSFATNGIDADLPKEEIYNRIEEIYFSYFGKDVFDAYLLLNEEDRNEYNAHTSIFLSFHRDLQRYDVHNLGLGNILALDSYGYDVLMDKMN